MARGCRNRPAGPAGTCHRAREPTPAFARSPLANPFLFAGTLAAVGAHVAALYLPVTQLVLRVEPLAAETWVRMTLVAASIIVMVELHKLIARRVALVKGATGH